MKWLSAGLTFVNVATVWGLLAGLAGHGLNKTVAISSAIAGLLAALLAYWGTCAAPPPDEPEATRSVATPESGPVQGRPALRSFWLWLLGAICAAGPVSRRYRSIWLWLMVALFAVFAVRSFCNVLFIDGNELKIQSPNNLGDLSLHLAYIKNFASGVALWPDNPIYVFSKLRYPAGVDLFNALFACLGVDVIRGLVWAGLLASAATCFALYRWAGTFGIAAFLFNGGLAGFQWFKSYEWNDYQGVPFIAWKSLALSMFVTQRGLLYALPVGLLLLYHWRAKFFAHNQGGALSPAPASSEPGGLEAAAPLKRPPLPFWVELTLYATLPLFHLHTFLALSLVLAFLYLFQNAPGHRQILWLAAAAFSLVSSFIFMCVFFFSHGSVKQVASLGAGFFLALSFVLVFLFASLKGPARKQLALLAGAAVVPATFFVWLITDHFHAGSVLHWNPGWVQNNGDFARPLAAFATQPGPPAAAVSGFFGTLKHFVQFWLINFGITLPLIIALLVLLVVRAWMKRDEPAPMKIRLISVLTTLALLAVVLVSLFAYLSFGSSLFIALALIPPVVIAILIPVFASLLQRDWKQTIPLSTPFAFVIPAVALFLFACLVKTAPWEWDNIKLIIWAYLIVLPFVWSEIVSRWVFPVRAIVCIALFGSGFVTLFGGLAAGKTGYGLADRTELDAVAIAVSKLPVEARFAAFPTFNHPLLLQGRKVVLGYPGHVWTQGFDYGEDANKLGALMNGAPGWKDTAHYFRARYLFWGREETRNYAQSTRPWEKELKPVASGPWGAIYDLEPPRDSAVPAVPVTKEPSTATPSLSSVSRELASPAANASSTPTPASTSTATPVKISRDSVTPATK
jgi:hypothetical protein